jgi:hypothetical protein
MVADAEATSRFATTARTLDLTAPVGTGPGTAELAALLIWPWGACTPIDRVLRIGRDPEFSPFARQLWADQRISRRHAEIEPGTAGIDVRDLGSSNGTYVGERLLGRGGSAQLRDDAQLQFGAHLAVKLVFLPPKPAAPA